MAELIETDDAGEAQRPQVVVDSLGNAIAVWDQDDGSRLNIWANRYVVGTGWGAAELIETNDEGGASRPKVAVDSVGDAVAVWVQSDNTHSDIWANRYVVGVGWGTAELIETDNSDDAWEPQIAVDSAGNAFVVWDYHSSSHIWSNRYVVGSGWGIAERLETDDESGAVRPQVAVDSAGNAIAVWVQYGATGLKVWANRYVVGVGWGTAELIETDNSSYAMDARAIWPQLAVDSAGNAIAVWHQYDGICWNIWANHYVVGVGWGTAELIETDNSGDARKPQIAVESAGNATAVWTQSDGDEGVPIYRIWANRYVVGSGWGSAELIETDVIDTGKPQVAVDPAGNAVAVWFAYDGTRYSIWANWYVMDSGWGTAELIDTDNAGDAGKPQVVVDSAGNAVAVWVQSDGTRDSIWANRYN